MSVAYHEFSVLSVTLPSLGSACRMENLFIIVILILVSCDHVQPQFKGRTAAASNSASYRGFKLLRMDTAASVVRDQKFLYDFLLPSKF